MPASISDFATQVAPHVGATGGVFRTQTNSDGSLSIFRAASNTSPGSPSNPWVLICPRVIYTSVFDTVTVGDGSDVATSPAPAFIAGLN